MGVFRGKEKGGSSPQNVLDLGLGSEGWGGYTAAGVRR